jgi:hypothetical protein
LNDAIGEWISGRWVARLRPAISVSANPDGHAIDRDPIPKNLLPKQKNSPKGERTDSGTMIISRFIPLANSIVKQKEQSAVRKGVLGRRGCHPPRHFV